MKRYEKEELEEDMVEEKLDKLSKSTGVFLDIEKMNENEYILNMKYSKGCYPLDVLILKDYESLYKALEHFECLGGLTNKFWELRTDEDLYKKYQDAQDLFNEEFKNNEILIDDL